LTKIGSGTLALTNVNTYSGNTFINAGTLALSGSSSISNSPLISVTNGAVFNVAGLTATFTLLSSQTLSNSAATTGTLNGSLTAAASSVVSVSYASGTPAFTVTNGTLTLNPSTVFNLNNTGAQLAGGNSYLVISNATTGSGGTVAFAASAPTVTVGGNGAAGAVSLATNNGALYLNVAGGVHTNAYLTGITLTPALSFTPGFNSNTLSGYVATEAYGTSFTVTVTNADVTATNYLTYNGTGINFLTNALAGSALSLNVNPAVTNVVQVTVTAQDGMTTRTYVVNVVELPDQTVKPVLTNSFNNGTLTLNWPLKNLGYRLLVQANNLANGISTNAGDWSPVLNSAATNTATINTTNVDDYYRLVYP
jgi:autotransporter-associated beta strand protein